MRENIKKILWILDKQMEKEYLLNWYSYKLSEMSWNKSKLYFRMISFNKI